MLRSYGLKMNTDTGLTRDPITGQIIPITGQFVPMFHHHNFQHQSANVTPVLHHHSVQHQSGNVTPVLHHQHAISSHKKGSSGVAAFEDYKGEQAFMLIHDHRGYSFGYGKKKPGSTSYDTAQAEEFEETCGLFDVRRGLDKNFQLRSCNGSEHSIYVIRVKGPSKEGIQSKYYVHNRSLIHGNPNAPKDFKETSRFTRVYVRDAIAAGALGLQNGTKLCVKDVYGNAVCMCSRDSEYLRDILRRKLNLTVPEHQLTLVKNVFDPSKPFLNGTYRYSI